MKLTNATLNAIEDAVTVDLNCVIRAYRGDMDEHVEIEHMPLSIVSPYVLKLYNNHDTESGPTDQRTVNTYGDALSTASVMVGGTARPDKGLARLLLEDVVTVAALGWTVVSVSEPFQTVYELNKTMQEARPLSQEPYHLNLANKDGIVIKITGGEGECNVAEVEVGGFDLNAWNWEFIMGTANLPMLQAAVQAAQEFIASKEPYVVHPGRVIHKFGKPAFSLRVEAGMMPGEVDTMAHTIARLLNKAERENPYGA